MSDQQGRRPLVDDEVHGSVKRYLQRILKEATPKAWVEGGESEDQQFRRRPRNYETLKKYEQVYERGGPITDLVDSRALMTYGTGIEFQTESLLTDDRGRTVDEWLHDQFGRMLDYRNIQLGQHAYFSGNGWAEIVETRGGDFSHISPIDPTTVDPAWDDHGQLTRVDQVIVENGQAKRQSFDPQDVAVFSFRDTPGGPLETGLVEQNWDEIQEFASNKEQRANAIELHGSPKYDISVGSEGQSIPDRIMRRIRNKFRPSKIDELTNWTHGGDIEIETLESPGFDGMGGILETDMQLLSQGFGIPLEWTNFGADGLGTGKPAESRQTKFERQARAEQGLRAAQFLEQIVEPILKRYSPFPADVDLQMQFGDVVSDQQAVTDWLSEVEWAYHRDEVREKMGDTPWDEDSEKEAPPTIAPSAQDGGEPGGGLFASDGSNGGDGDQDHHDHHDHDRHEDFSERRRALLQDSVAEGELVQEELVFEQVVEEVLWSDDTSRELFQFDPEEVPDFVVERLQEAVREGAVFDDFETIPNWAAGEVEDVMLDSLEQRHGWSIDSIAENLQSMALGLDKQDAERIARTETQALVAEAREQGYRDREDFEDLRFRWVGPSDNRTTDACSWIKDQIPEDGVSLEELKQLVDDANDQFIDHASREWTPHIGCRHQPIRSVT